MANEIDIATARSAAELERHIAAARNNVPHSIGPELCEHCDDRIPHVRRQLGYNLCVPCAATAERERQVYAGRVA